MTTTTPDLATLMRGASGGTWYGITLDIIGDDGQWIIAVGHVDPRRMAAAAQRLCRGLTGDRRLYGDVPAAWPHPLAYAVAHTRHAWAVVRTPWCPDCGDHDPGGCSEMYEWGLDWSEDTPGRDVPITILDWA